MVVDTHTQSYTIKQLQGVISLKQGDKLYHLDGLTAWKRGWVQALMTYSTWFSDKARYHLFDTSVSNEWINRYQSAQPQWLTSVSLQETAHCKTLEEVGGREWFAGDKRRHSRRSWRGRRGRRQLRKRLTEYESGHQSKAGNFGSYEKTEERKKKSTLKNLHCLHGC